MQAVADEYQEFLDTICEVGPDYKIHLHDLYNAYTAFRNIDRYCDSKPVFAAIIGKVFSKTNFGGGVRVHGVTVNYPKLYSYLSS